MKKLALAVVAALAVAGCGSSADAESKSWTTKEVQREYKVQLAEDFSEVDVSCLLADGEEGASGTLKCHVEYEDTGGEDGTSTVEIDVDKTGFWIAG